MAGMMLITPKMWCEIHFCHIISFQYLGPVTDQVGFCLMKGFAKLFTTMEIRRRAATGFNKIPSLLS